MSLIKNSHQYFFTLCIILMAEKNAYCMYSGAEYVDDDDQLVSLQIDPNSGHDFQKRFNDAQNAFQSLSLYQSTPQPEPETSDQNKVQVITKEQLKEHYPGLFNTFYRKNTCIIDAKRLADNLHTKRSINALNHYLSEGRSRKYQYFALLFDCMLTPLRSEDDIHEALTYFDSIENTLQAMVGIMDEHTMMPLQNAIRYLQLEGLKLIIPKEISEKKSPLRKLYPTTFIITMLSQSKPRWLLCHYKGNDYHQNQSWHDHFIQQILIPRLTKRIYEFEITILVSALEDWLTQRDTMQLDINKPKPVEILVHSLYRQRGLLYRLTRNYHPGMRTEKEKRQDKHLEKQLTDIPDDDMKLLFKELNTLSANHSVIARKAFSVLVESPLLLLPIIKTLKCPCSPTEEVKRSFFEWLSGLAIRAAKSSTERLFDIAIQEWPILYYHWTESCEQPIGATAGLLTLYRESKTMEKTNLQDKIKENQQALLEQAGRLCPQLHQ